MIPPKALEVNPYVDFFSSFLRRRVPHLDGQYLRCACCYGWRRVGREAIFYAPRGGGVWFVCPTCWWVCGHANERLSNAIAQRILAYVTGGRP